MHQNNIYFQFLLTWFLWGLWRSTHCVIKNATIALPPNAVMCARTIAKTSITKLWVKPLNPPFCNNIIVRIVTIAFTTFRWEWSSLWILQNSPLVSTYFHEWKRNLGCLDTSLFFHLADKIKALYQRHIFLSKAPIN